MELATFDYFTGNSEELAVNLNKFLKQFGARKNFNEFNENELRSRIWMRLFGVMTNSEYESSRAVCLAALRVLSRDKTDIDKLITDQRIKLLLKFAKLTDDFDAKDTFVDDNGVIETLKVICNLIYNSSGTRILVLQTSLLQKTVLRLRKHWNTLSHEERLFLLRILFLLTALCYKTRAIVKNELNGDIDLINMIDGIWKRHTDGAEAFDTDKSVIASEILKILFNLNIQTIEETSHEEEYKRLALTSRELLVEKHVSSLNELQSDIVNLITVLPTSSYSVLVPSIEDDNHEYVYCNFDMRAVSALLKFLERRLDSNTDLSENVSPVLTVLIKLSKHQRFVRKYVRLQILPPLTDVMQRPEEGITLRAKLCKLLTSPLTNLRDLVAEMIFILCKENVGRMVKYTGYGNAAGMFANRGLLGNRPSKAAYSSESEDSDTEEYIKYKEQINPVTGCYERPKPNPMEGMSEERKEYEALQLVQLMDQLTREGIVHPCRIGEDGRPKPIEHVLELQSDSK